MSNFFLAPIIFINLQVSKFAAVLKKWTDAIS